MLAPGTYLQNRFRILSPLGKGGMGRVYAAADEALDCTVAIKQTFASTDDLRRAFKREARLLANLRHPVLPRVTHHFTEGDEQFLVMDYVEGDNLETLLFKRGRPFSHSEILPIADKLLDALQYLHSFKEPIIHRDIKPANIKLSGGENVFLLDFGLAKGIVGQATTQATGHLSVYGYTAHYAPMEQISSSGTNAQSDLFSLGATLYHLLTGCVPLPSGDRYIELEQEMPDPLLTAIQVNPEVPASLSTLISQAMEMRRKDRFASASEMRRALQDSLLESTPSKAGVDSTVELDHARNETTGETVAISFEDHSTIPNTRNSLTEAPPELLKSIETEIQTAWAIPNDTGYKQTRNKSISFGQRVDKTITQPSLLRVNSVEDDSPPPPRSGRLRVIIAGTLVVFGMLVALVIYLQSPNEAPTTINSPAQSNFDLSRLTSEAAEAAKTGNRLKQENKRREADKEFARAEQLYQSAVAIEPSSPALHVSLASIYIYREKWPEAIEEYREAVRLDPNNEESKSNLKLLEAKVKKIR